MEQFCLGANENVWDLREIEEKSGPEKCIKSFYNAHLKSRNKPQINSCQEWVMSHAKRPPGPG
jgi:hypothetical protein